MKAPFDLSKLRKSVSKSIPGMSGGFNDPKTFLDTGFYALNYLMANRFDGGVPLEGKSTQFAGDSGAGKSFLVANLLKDCKRKGIYAILIDTENALDEDWLQALDVDTSPEHMYKWIASTIDDVAKFITQIIDQYKEENEEIPYDQRAKLAIFIDSVGMLITPTMENQFEAGDLKGDLGKKAQQLTTMMRVATAKIASQPIGIIFTNHVMDSQDKYAPDKISGGKMLEFATSMIVQMNKWLLKEDEDGKDTKEVMGIKPSITIRKSRYSKPFVKLRIEIPYVGSVEPTSGLFDLLLEKGMLKKEGNSYVYISRETGEIHKEMRKNYKKKGIFDLIIKEFPLWDSEDGMDVGFDLTGATEKDLEE